jgi:hypothetical protein
MPFGAVGKELDQRRPGVGPRAVRRPTLGGMEEIRSGREIRVLARSTSSRLCSII